MENETIFFYLTWLGIFFLLLIGVYGGWILNDYFKQQKINELPRAAGLYLPYEPNWTSAMNTSRYYDTAGDWICINLKNYNFEDSKRIVEHEISHEIFARYCSKNNNFNKCMNLTNETA